MNRYIIGIDGMMCGMCEMHVEQKIKESFRLKKAKASHITNKLTVIAEGEFSKEDFEKALAPTGYRITSFNKEQAEKSLFGWR